MALFLCHSTIIPLYYSATISDPLLLAVRKHVREILLDNELVHTAVTQGYCVDGDKGREVVPVDKARRRIR